MKGFALTQEIPWITEPQLSTCPHSIFYPNFWMSIWEVISTTNEENPSNPTVAKKEGAKRATNSKKAPNEQRRLLLFQ